MKTRIRQTLLCVATLALAAAAAAQESQAPVQVNVDGLPTHVRNRIIEKAQHGQTAVIQYLQRTQTVHQLRPESVIRNELQPVVVIPKLAQSDVNRENDVNGEK